jgi:hypothetical protein
MANVENYLFHVEADTNQAQQSLRQIVGLMNQLERINDKGIDNYFTTNQKDMDKAMRSMSDLVKVYNDLNDELENMLENQEKLSTVPEPKKPVQPRKPKENASDEAKQRYESRQKEYESKKKQWDDEVKHQNTLKQFSEANMFLIRQQMAAIKNAFRDAKINLRQLSSMEQNYSKNFVPIGLSNNRRNFSQNDKDAHKQMEELLDDAAQVTPTQKVSSQIKDILNLNRRSKTLSRRAKSAQYMSTMEAASISQDYRTVNRDFGHVSIDNQAELMAKGQQRAVLSDEVTALKNREANDQNARNERVQKEHEIKLIDEEIAARIELDRVLNMTTEAMKDYWRDIQGVEVKPKRGSMRGMFYERAPAIAFAMGGAVQNQFGGMYGTGRGLSQANRPNQIMIGQMTGMDGGDWRAGIRDYAYQQGLKNYRGMTQQDMLSLESNYLTNKGFSGQKDLHAAMNNQADFSRVNGLTTDETSNFFGGLYQSGGVNGAQTKTIQDAFVGAIKRSGMEGREKDQLSALNSIVTSVSDGKNISNSQVMNLMGIQSMFARAGDRSVQGLQGGQFLSDLNTGIKQGSDDPMVRLVFGQGTKYQGLQGRWDLTKQMEKGISDPENLRIIGRLAEGYGGNDKKSQNMAAYGFVREKLGVNVTTNQIEALMKLYRSGSFDQKAIDKVLKEDTSTGKTESKKKMDSYKDSNEARDNMSDATYQKLSNQLYDITGWLRSINVGIGNLTNGASGLGGIALAGAYGIGSGGMHMLGFLIADIVMLRMAESIRNVASSRFGQTGIGNLFRRMLGRNGNPPPNGPTPTTPGGGGTTPLTPEQEAARREATAGQEEQAAARSGGRGASFGRVGEATFGRFVNPSTRQALTYGLQGGATTVDGAGQGTLAALSKLNKFSKVLGKVAFPLAAITGAMEIGASDRNKYGETTGKVVGGLAGGWAGAEMGAAGGAAIGAAIGSIVPIIGTAIGGAAGTIIGGIAGAFGGNWIGRKGGGALGSTFDPSKAEAAGLDGSESTTGAGQPTDTTDKSTTNLKYQSEVKRSGNILFEKENLTRYSTILDRTSQLLSQSRAQNGIIGNTGGLGTTSYGGGGNTPITVGAGGTGGGTGTLTGKSNSAKIWNFFKGQGVSDTAAAAILGNLQAESSLDPTAVNKKSGAFGIGQWLGDRKKALFNYSSQNGLDPNSLQTQLQYMWKEIQSGQYGSLATMSGMTPAQAAVYFESKFEKSGGDLNSERQGYANGFYNQYHGSSAQNNYKPGTSSSGGYTMLNTKPTVTSSITVNVKPDQSVAQQVNNSQEMQNTAKYIQQMVYGSMNYYSKEMTRL